MHEKKWTYIVTLFGLVGASLCHAEQASTSPALPRGATATSSTEMDEVVVRGTHLWELRAAIEEAENRFYRRYNELNKVDDFDIECTVEAPTGTQVKRRSCVTKLQQKVQAEYARDYIYMLQRLSDELPASLPDSDPNSVMQMRYQEYKENVLYLLKTNPELRQLVYQRDAAEKRYNNERRKQHKGRLVLLK
jgi:hypothetical protein